MKVIVIAGEPGARGTNRGLERASPQAAFVRAAVDRRA
jgi:hypothetical protein